MRRPVPSRPENAEVWQLLEGARTMAKALRAALYLRVGTGEQSVENQRRDLEAAATRRGWTIVRSYTDQGVCEPKECDKRPSLDAMLREAARGKFEVVMCWAADRMGRSLAELAGTLQELHGAKVDLFLYRQAIDTTTSASRPWLFSPPAWQSSAPAAAASFATPRRASPV